MSRQRALQAPLIRIFFTFPHKLFRPTGSSAYKKIKVVTTGKRGTFTTNLKASQGGTWYAEFLGTDYWNAKQSTGTWVKVAK